MATWRERLAGQADARFGLRQANADARDRDRGVEKITVMAEYGCSGLWRGRSGGPVRPEDLGLSEALVARVWAWSHQFQIELEGVDPESWAAEGRAIAVAIGEELGDTAKVTYRE